MTYVSTRGNEAAPGPDFVSLLNDAVPVRSIAEERLHRKQRLAATFRLFARYGFDQVLAGHVTARDPEHNRRLLRPIVQRCRLCSLGKPVP